MRSSSFIKRPTATTVEAVYAATVRWPPDLGGPSRAAVQSIVRDTVMAENVDWVMRQEGEQGKVVSFEHNGHVMNET